MCFHREVFLETALLVAGLFVGRFLLIQLLVSVESGSCSLIVYVEFITVNMLIEVCHGFLADSNVPA